MKGHFLCVLVLGVIFCSLPAVVAQSQPGNVPPNGAVYPQGPPPSYQAAPPELTLPAGTLITVRTTELLSSDKNKPGDAFTSLLEQPLVAQGWVVARLGQAVEGRVAAAQPAGRVQGVSQLAVELSELVLVDGNQIPIRTELVESSAGTSRGRDAEGIGTTTGIGAAVGAAAGGGRGAAIGAAAGAVAGVVGVLTTRGRATELYPEAVLTFRLQDPVSFSTLQSRQAFQPVTQQDYNNRGGAERNPPRYRNADAYPPPYYYPPYYWSGVYPPFGYYGYYGYYGFGPRIYISPRGYFGRGYGRRR